jgi:conjugal transfer/type IV secretion protein DotA/TraY
VATPVWVAAHLHPHGESPASRQAANGYMVLLELLVRPVFMIFGLIIAIDPGHRFAGQALSGDP